MNRVAAVVVTYNRKDKLRNCIDALLGQSSADKPDIFIVDNNSCDGTREMVGSYAGGRGQSRIIYKSTGYNSGGAGGFCYGIRKAVEAGYDYVWLMDDDCIPSADALGELMKYDAEHHGEYGFLSSKVLWKDGTPCAMNVPRVTMTRDLSDWGGEAVSIVMASFVSLLIPAEVIREAGLPFRKFFIWTDDWEYTRRISRKYKCWLVQASTVIHDTAVNEGARIESAPPDRVDRFRYLYRNDVYLYRREGIRGFAYEAARLPLHCMRIAFSRNSLSEKIRRIGIVIGGTSDGLGFYPEPERADESS